MWKHVWHIFEQEGANDNVIWLWSPNNTDQYGESDEILWWYPGDSYVDWVGMSAFNWGTSHDGNVWRDLKSSIWLAQERLATLEKPMMISETSSVSIGGSKEGWFMQTFTEDLPTMNWIKAVVIFNKDFGKADFNLDSGMDHEKVINEVIVGNDYYLKQPLFYYQ
jgi:beta-mannanase